MSFIEFDSVYKTYKMGEVTINAADGVTFNIEQGEFCIILGASGAGKTTILNILGGMDNCDDGKVRVGGDLINEYDNKSLIEYRRFDVGFVFQFYNLIPVLNVEENMTLPMLLDGRKAKKERVEEMLKLLGLTERRRHLPSQLSGGQQQRTSIGRALFTSPNIILADEPTGNLDSKNSAEIIALLRKSNQEFNQTMMIITHDENIALQCDRILTISDGRIVEDVLTHQT